MLAHDINDKALVLLDKLNMAFIINFYITLSSKSADIGTQKKYNSVKVVKFFNTLNNNIIEEYLFSPTVYC